jgi:hypothetical protein
VADASTIKRILSETKVLAQPKRALSSFGDTKVDYHLVSIVDGDGERCRLREGSVLAEKPLILTADALKERFEGFGEEGREYSRWLQSAYAEALRALEYKFKNQPGSTRVLRQNALETAERIKAEVGAGSRDAAVLLCPDFGWQLALMRFSLEESLRSFPVNVRDLDRRGLFDPDKKEGDRKRREIEDLFRRAAADRSQVKALGERLKSCGLFGEYEDRFYSLLG